MDYRNKVEEMFKDTTMAISEFMEKSIDTSPEVFFAMLGTMVDLYTVTHPELGMDTEACFLAMAFTAHQLKITE